jgi:hypothetical protein
LEGRGGVGQSKKHDSWFKESQVGNERCFPFVSFFDSDVVVPPAHIELGEERRAFHSIDQLGDEWQGITVLYGPFIYFSVVLDRSQLAVFLFDKEEGGGIRTFGWADVSLLRVFFHKLLKGFLL